MTAIPNDGYEFDGWYENGVKIADIGAIYTFTATKDRTLEVRFIPDVPTTTSYTITFNANGGSVTTETMQTNENGTLPNLPTPTRSSNYRFDGWFSAQTDGTQITTNTVFESNMTIFAHWTDIDENTDGDTYYPPITPTPTDDNLPSQQPNQDIETTTEEPDIPNEKTPESTYINPFKDIKETDWFYNDIIYVCSRELMNGTNNDTFSPNMTLTRGMVVTVLGRYHEVDIEKYTQVTFNDVDGSMYYAPYIEWAKSIGIVNGYGDGKFGADDNITRQDLAVILLRYLNYIKFEYIVTEEYRLFADEDKIADYAKNAIQVLNKLGIINGKGNNIIDPKGEATRAEFAAMLHRFLEKLT